MSLDDVLKSDLDKNSRLKSSENSTQNSVNLNSILKENLNENPPKNSQNSSSNSQNSSQNLSTNSQIKSQNAFELSQNYTQNALQNYNQSRPNSAQSSYQIPQNSSKNSQNSSLNSQTSAQNATQNSQPALRQNPLYKALSTKVLFRADSSTKIGHGHIRRDLVLAKSYENDEVCFACRDLQGSLIDEIPYEVYLLETMDIEELIWLVKDEGFELVVIDHYGISEDDERRLKKETGVKLLCFDDEIKPHYCDILLNVNPYAKAALYDKLVPIFCEVRCGFAYSLIREEFYKESGIVRAKIYDYFICLGGTDALNLSAQIALEMQKNKQIFIATTSKNPNLKMLQIIANANKNITLGVDIKDFARVMNESKKLIISASSLVNEAIFLKADFKAICTAKNQLKIAQWLRKSGREVEFYGDF